MGELLYTIPIGSSAFFGSIGAEVGDTCRPSNYLIRSKHLGFSALAQQEREVGEVTGSGPAQQASPSYAAAGPAQRVSEAGAYHHHQMPTRSMEHSSNSYTLTDYRMAVSGEAGQPRCLRHLRRRTQPSGGDQRRRNTRRGIRGQETQCKRTEQRSLKRRAARRLARKRKPGSTPATAQEPFHRKVTTLRYKIRMGLRVASMNVRGVTTLDKRILVEEWMGKRRVDMLLLQETKQSGESRLCRQRYTWYFSGGTDQHAPWSSDRHTK